MKKTSGGKIAFVEVEEAWERAYLKKAFPDAVVLKDAAESGLAPLKNAEVLSVFIKSRVSAGAIGKLPKLRFITTRSTGFDHIDLNAAKKRGIPVSNVPTYGENTVAEHTFALILSLSRNLRKAYLRTLQNNFRLDGLMGFDLKGKTLGVVGTGNIGLHVVRMGAGFGMNVIAFDVKRQHFLSEVLNFEYVALDELFARSDIISLHVPFLPSTKHLINARSIRKIKRGAILINTARGGLVETGALAHALDQGILAGAGLDVLEEEEFILEEKRLIEETGAHWSKLQTVLKNQVLLHRENVVYTPHMAFYSREAVRRILDTTIENIRAFRAGTPANRVN